MDKNYWFKSDKFSIDKREDEETNPLCFGKALAIWLSEELSDLGYKTDVIPEDWGWCVMCESTDYMLWVGCGCSLSDKIIQEYTQNKIPKGSDVVWHVFSTIEVPFFNFKALIKKWFGKLDLDTPLTQLNLKLESTLKSEPAIVFCDEP